MLHAVQTAQYSINFESYIFEHDTAGTHDFVEALRVRALAGVAVTVVIDRFGSWYLGQGQEAALRATGVDLVYYGRFFRRIHRKVLVVDRKVAFIGGVNIGKRYQKWADLHLRVAEPAIVEALVRSFWNSYKASGGTRHTEESQPQTFRERAGMWLLDHWPISGRSTLRAYYEEQIKKAEKSIAIVTPYFVPHRWFSEALRAAVRRGVEVDVILPANTDPAIMKIPNLVATLSLSRAGVRIFFTKVMNHAKVLLIDDRIGLVGSQNIDAMSFDFNAEVGVSFTEPDMVRDLKQITERWKREADEFSHATFKRRWYHPVIEFVVDLFQPVL